jgi:peptidoglycan/LPS O-acetylase OafA/YrhL
MRIPSLDGLRAISIACVLLAHLSGTRNFFTCRILELYGNFGVRVFFVISGYLITNLLLREQEKTGTVSLRDFYLRRVYRIFPAAYAFMIIAIAANWRVLSWSNLLTAITYTSNYYHGGNWILGHLWSLSVEEQFYLVWPLTLLLSFRARVPIVLAVIVSGPPLRILFWLLWGRRGLEHPFPVLADTLAMGCLLAILSPRLKAWQQVLTSRWFLAVPVLTIVMPLLQLYNNRAYQVAGLTMMHAGIALSIEHAVKKNYWLLNLRPIVWIGALSYSLYLWQQPFLNRNVASVWTAFPLNLAVALLCAAGSYYLVEQPFLAMRERRRRRA